MDPARRLSARGIIFYKGKLLCVRLKPYHGSIRGDFWCTPGGGLDPGEPLLEGVRREMVEETGIEPQIGALLYIQQFGYNNVEQLEFFFHITNPKAYLSIDLSKTTHGQDEIEKIDFVDPATTTILPKFLSSTDIAADIEQGSTTVFNLF